MAGNCRECGQTIPDGHVAPQKPAFIPIGAERKFAAICRQLSLMPNVSPRHKGALEDLPTTVSRYKQLTVGQWKMFCAVVKDITGSWPEDKKAFEREEAEPEPESHSLPEDEELIPF